MSLVGQAESPGQIDGKASPVTVDVEKSKFPKLSGILPVVRTLSTSAFAKALGVSDSSVRRMADAGELEIHRTRGGHRRIPVSEAVRYIRDTRTPVLKPELLGLASAPQQFDAQSAWARMLQVLEEGHAPSVIGLMQWLYASGMNIAELCDDPTRQRCVRSVIAGRMTNARYLSSIERQFFIAARLTNCGCRFLNPMKMHPKRAVRG